MRELSCQFIPYNSDLDFALFDEIELVDCGDCDVILANAEKTFANAQRDIGAILDAGAIPATLGGDHSITIPAVARLPSATRIRDWSCSTRISTRRSTSPARP